MADFHGKESRFCWDSWRAQPSLEGDTTGPRGTVGTVGTHFGVCPMSKSHSPAFDAVEWLSALFDDGAGPPASDNTATDDAPSIHVALEDDTTETTDPEALELLGHATEWGEDGWPIDTVAQPPACGRCGSLDAWLPIAGPSTTTHPETWKTAAPKWRCMQCDAPERSKRTRARAAYRRAIGATPHFPAMKKGPNDANYPRS